MKFTDRYQARKYALQAIYSWQLSKNNFHDIQYYFLNESIQDIKNIDIDYFNDLINGVIVNSIYLDNVMKPFLSRKLFELGQIEKAILRISLYELINRLDVPYKVVINESIYLAKSFGGVDNSYKFINGVLDKIANKLRI
ncbi:transcription antitermination factor NusB [Enterobacteriaceae endosymbiont of Donacia versicolorea]|uniref:transcription antitermination factor NusB n=1 Tax=unclassified Enterobacteriaceae TaxID=36866 RepID=UPI001449D653|nr:MULTISPECIES: transcription antitermination factor NusB [unclassified Enterobacteriaceae]QJC31925.1 transcription antitermination factor NusB [Enterobacteriaceae endosymbiont of Donacia versicolorea]QJC32332.1 transcription antitermination factor NusB [Enterobacteriaceae endosymbiont of Donacia dentata]